MPGEESEEALADPEAEGQVVGDDADSSVGLGKQNSDISSIMANLEDIIASLGGGAEEEEPVPDDQYGA
jgi:archaellum component FlaC